MTLRELLDAATKRAAEFKDDNLAGFVDAIESWAYGEERECEGCEWSFTVYPRRHITPCDCPTCHGTGTIRTCGLDERVFLRAVTARLAGDDEDVAWGSAIRGELGSEEG